MDNRENRNERKWLKDLRVSAGYSQQYVAEKLGVCQQYYCMVERGERQRDMSISIAGKLAKIFDVSIEMILEKENEGEG